LDKIQNELSKAGNWSAKIASNSKFTETLRSFEEEDLLLLHPSGHLEFRQVIAPLERRISKYGNNYIAKQPIYQISNFKIGGNTPDQKITLRPVKGFFARGQYEELSNDEKISTKDFEEYIAGYQIEGFEVEDIVFGDDMEKIESGYQDILPPPKR